MTFTDYTITELLDSFGGQLLAATAKVLASAIFVSDRRLEEAMQNSAPLPAGTPDSEPLYTVEVDEQRRELTLTLNNGISRTARHIGDQGCIIIPTTEDLKFTPVPVQSKLGDATHQHWPIGDAPALAPSPIQPGSLHAAVESAFANADDCTAAFLVIHRGDIVAERYGAGAGPDTQLESWSMGKTITAALIGRLIQQGHLKLDDPAPVPAWQAAGDERSAITIRDLMQMSSGLSFSAAQTPGEWFDHGYPDHTRVYTGEVDVFDFSISQPPEHPPQTVGRYRNCDPLVLGYLIKQAALDCGEEYLTFPQRHLFDHIGIRRQVLETDRFGNFILTGFDYGTARNWGRLGMLFLNDGMFEGKRLLPEGFCEFVRTPAPAWERPEYGGQCWLNGVGDWPLPEDTMIMAGTGGQNVFVVPSHDLVIVRMGHRRGMPTYASELRTAQSQIIATIEDCAQQ